MYHITPINILEGIIFFLTLTKNELQNIATTPETTMCQIDDATPSICNGAPKPAWWRQRKKLPIEFDSRKIQTLSSLGLNKNHIVGRRCEDFFLVSPCVSERRPLNSGLMKNQGFTLARGTRQVLTQFLPEHQESKCFTSLNQQDQMMSRYISNLLNLDMTSDTVLY